MLQREKARTLESTSQEGKAKGARQYAVRAEVQESISLAIILRHWMDLLSTTDFLFRTNL